MRIPYGFRAQAHYIDPISRGQLALAELESTGFIHTASNDVPEPMSSQMSPDAPVNIEVDREFAIEKRAREEMRHTITLLVVSL